MRTSIVAIMLLLLAATAAGQRWEFEQVDAAGWGAGVQMRRHPDGRLFLCYSNIHTGQIRIASFDTVWHYEDTGLRTALNSLYFDEWQAFDIARSGALGLAFVDSVGAQSFRYYQRTDTAWVRCDVPLRAWVGAPKLAFDSAGTPCISFGTLVSSFAFASRPDSVWIVETLPRGATWPVVFTWAEQLCFDTNNHPHALYMYFWDFPDGISGREVDGTELWYCRNDGDTWRESLIAQTGNAPLSAPSLALDSGNRAGYCCRASGFRYMGELLTPDPVHWSCLVYDTLNRPNVVWSDRDRLVFCYRSDQTWRSHLVLVDSGIEWKGDLRLENGQPVIALSRPSGLWLARGYDVTDMAERPTVTVVAGAPPATAVRGVLRMGDGRQQPGDRAELLDAAGRRVMELRPGVNDVRHLSPGVYFVIERGARDQGIEGSRRKVIVTK